MLPILIKLMDRSSSSNAAQIVILGVRNSQYQGNRLLVYSMLVMEGNPPSLIIYQNA